jgi:transcriptional antiterminator
MAYLSDRQEQILSVFLQTKGIVTSKHLALITNVSTRTIKKDIVELNAFLADYNAVVYSKASAGYWLQSNSSFLFQQLKTKLKNKRLPNQQEIPQYRYERVNYLVKKFLTIDYHLKIEDLMEELYVSRSTLIIDLHEVREFFKSYELSLETKPGFGLSVHGDEITKRICIADVFFHASVSTGFYATDNVMFVSQTNQSEITFIKDLIQEKIAVYDIQLSEQSVQNFIIHIIIAIRRWRFYNYVKPDDSHLNIRLIMDTPEYNVAKEMKEALEEKYSILLPDTEIAYFALHLYSKKINESNVVDSNLSTQVEEVLTLIDDALYQMYGIQIADNTLFYNNIKLHIPTMVLRLRTGLVMRNPTVYENITVYQLATHITLLIAKVIEDYFKLHININEFGYLVLYTNLLLNQENLRPNMNILLVSGRGRPETISLINEINEKYYKYIENIDTTDAQTLITMDLDSYDMVISTVPMEYQLSKPYYYLISNQSYSEQIEFAFINCSYQIKRIQDYFRPDYFLDQMTAGSRDEMFAQVAAVVNPQEEAHIVELLWQSERILSHETTRRIVFLHTSPLMEDEFVLVALTKRPIIWMKQWVEMVIWVNIHDFDECSSCYRLMEQITKSETFLPKVKEQKYEYLMALIQQYNERKTTG